MNGQVRIVINTQSAAFEDDTPGELVRILQDLTNKIEHGEIDDDYMPTTLRDINGNGVGYIEFEPDEGGEE